MPVVWCRGIPEMFGDVWDRGGVKMLINVSEIMVWFKMGREMYSNIKYLCGWGAIGKAWSRFQLVDSISGLKSGRGVSHHLNW